MPEPAKSSARRAGLPGKFARPVQVTFIGAGSRITPELVSDILHIPGADQVRIALVDTDEERLGTMLKVVRKLIKLHDKPRWTAVASSNRREMLGGSDYVIHSIGIGDAACFKEDYEIPLRYNVDQCLGDTIGPGGLFRALRTIPVWLQILADAEKVCPDALVLNYANPMNMLCLAADRGTKMKVFGLCHTVQTASQLLAERAGVAFDDMVWDCAGINRLAWFTKLEHNGHDLYPALIKKAREDLAGKPSNRADAGDKFRKDLLSHVGAFPAGSSGHVSESVPFYRHRKDVREALGGPGSEGESGFYAKQWPTWRKQADFTRVQVLTDDSALKWTRSHEYASWIIEAREKDVPHRVYGNVPNLVQGSYALISNLPADGCVEVACRVDRTGIHPIRYGILRRPLAALCDANMRMFDLGVRAAMDKSKDAAIHALMLDPLTAAVCSPAEIKNLVLEMFKAQEKWLPDYK